MLKRRDVSIICIEMCIDVNIYCLGVHRSHSLKQFTLAVRVTHCRSRSLHVPLLRKQQAINLSFFGIHLAFDHLLPFPLGYGGSTTGQVELVTHGQHLQGTGYCTRWGILMTSRARPPCMNGSTTGPP